MSSYASSFRDRREGRYMKTVSYKDPYEPLSVVIQIDDDDEEGLEEILAFLNDDARLTQNMERKERYHMKYHLEGLIYEEVDYASQEDLEADVEMSETEKLIDTWLQDNLTVVQYQRFKLFMEGLSIREIAKTDRILIMKNGELIQEGTEKEITDKVEGCVWKCIVSEKEAGQITSSFIVSNMRSSGENVELRIVSERQPVAGAENVESTLEEAYLYHTQITEGEKNATL